MALVILLEETRTKPLAEESPLNRVVCGMSPSAWDFYLKPNESQGGFHMELLSKLHKVKKGIHSPQRLSVQKSDLTPAI